LAISVSVGLAPVSAEHSSVQTLIHSAEQASRLARAEGSNNIHVYQSGDQHLEDVRINTRWAMKLRQALREDQLVLYAQPILASGQEHALPTRFEVLVRMIDEGRLVSPAEFLPAIEKHGLATDLDRWVVENTLNYLGALPDEVRARAERVSINLSGHSLDSQAFREFVIRRLRRATVPPQIICFEITETAAVVHMDGAVEFINALQDYGVTFALDDFGAGVSSFGYLRSLPVDCLKVDGQFVRHIDASPFDRGIVSAINEIAHAMGMETVAEFVENASLVQQLASIGVDYLQGHHIGAPQPLAFYLGVDDAMSRAAESSGR
jgi:Amt family ammonium transporter